MQGLILELYRECIKSIAFYDCINCDFFKNLQKSIENYPVYYLTGMIIGEDVYWSNQCSHDYLGR